MKPENRVKNKCVECKKKFKSRRGAKFCSAPCKNKNWIKYHPRIKII